MFLGFDILVFGLMVYYFSEVMTEPDMEMFIMDGGQPAENMPDEESDMTVVRMFIEIYLAMNVLLYITVNIRATLLKIPTIWT